MEAIIQNKDELLGYIQQRKDEITMIPILQNKLILFDQTKISQEEIIAFLNIYISSSDVKRSIRQLLFSIDSLFTFRKIGIECASFLLTLPEIKEKIELLFTPNELIFIFEQKRLLLLLLDVKLITVKSLINEVCSGESFFYYFFPEIQEYDSIAFETQLNEKFSHLIPLPSIEQHDRLRRINENNNDPAKMIRDDNITEFKNFFGNNDINVNEFIEFSSYDRNEFVSSRTLRPTLIEYAAFFSSLKIFRFLYAEGAIIRPGLILYAVAGGNLEIFQFVERLCKIDSEVMRVAIQFHQIEIVDYLRDNYDIQFTFVMLQQSILANNFVYFFELLEMFKYNLNDKENGDPLLNDAVNRGYTEVIELLSVYPYSLAHNSYSIDFDNKDFTGFTAIQMAILNDRIDLVEYLLQFPNSDENLNQCFRFAASRLDREDILKLLLKLPQIDVNQYYRGYGENALLSAIEYNNITVVNILVNDPRVDLTAKFWTRENYGQTALKYCHKHNYKEIAELLRKAKKIIHANTV